MSNPSDEYVHNLDAFKRLLNKYTIADLKSMIYDIPVKESGACCYPAMQTLLSLMEMLGKIERDKEGEEAIKVFVDQLPARYQINNLERNLYDLFRNGIAHNSLAKGGVVISKNGDKNIHLSNGGKNFDIKILFEDFLPIYENLFSIKLRNQNWSYYESNLKKVLKELKVSWLELSEPNFFTDPFLPTISGMRASGASGIGGPITFTP